MKQTLLLLFTTVFLFNLNAQFSIEPANLSGEGLDSDEYVILETTVANAASSEANIWWDLDPTNLIEGWDYQLCDKNLCYNWNFQTCPPDNPNEFNANQEWPFTVKVRANGIAGEGSIDLHLTDANGTIIGTSVLDYSFSPTTSVEDLYGPELSIFPNPTSEDFQVRNDQLVSKVAVYNIVGKRLFNYNHVSGNTYNVAHLQKGMYLVRLFDKNDIVLNVFRLNKN